MNIKGPTGNIPADIESQKIEPTAPTSAARNTQPSPSQSVLLKLTPNLFQIGQILKLVVAKVDRNSVLLLLQDSLLDKDGVPLKMQFRVAKTSPVEIGQRLTVQVSELNNKLPKLDLISIQKPPMPLQNMLVQSQAKQQPLQGLLDNFFTLASRSTQISNLPKEITEKIQSLLQALPEASKIQQSNELKHGIINSGAFMESQLLKTAQAETHFNPDADTKTNLLRLAEAIRHQHQHLLPLKQDHKISPSTYRLETVALSRAITNQQNNTSKTNLANAFTKIDPDIPSPPQRQHIPVVALKSEQILEQLLQQVEGALQRTLSHQLHMLNHDHPRQPIILELPVRNGQEAIDIFDLRIHPDQEGNAEADEEQGSETDSKTWTVMMSFNLAGLGPVRAQISYANNKVSTHWWAEEDTTVALFKNNIATLKSRLVHVGAEINTLDCYPGCPKISTQSTTTHYNASRFDEKI